MDTEPLISAQRDLSFEKSDSMYPPLPSLTTRQECTIVFDCNNSDVGSSRSPVHCDEENTPLSKKELHACNATDTHGTLTDVTMGNGACGTSTNILETSTAAVSTADTRESPDKLEKREVHSKKKLEGTGVESTSVMWADEIEASRDNRTDDTSTDSSIERPRPTGGSSKRKKSRKGREKGNTITNRTRSRSRTIISGAVRDRMSV
jgi:hypothetical protein